MSGLLGSVYSFGDSLKRKVRGLLSDPLAQIQLNMNQAAGGFNDAMRSPATDYARAGGVMADDPSTQAAIRAEADRRIGALMNVMPGGLLGATVWHGSPHKFAKFDASKIGTGEGAQAYGHGLYLAEAQGVGQGYADALSAKSGPLNDAAKHWRDNGGEPAFRQFAKDAGLPQSQIEETAKAINDRGYLYKVDLPDNMIARMLDWDKPLSEQAPEVRRAVTSVDARKLGFSPEKDTIGEGLLWTKGKKRIASSQLDAGAGRIPSATEGRDAYTVMNMLFGGGSSSSEALRQLGIPGIRYLDGGSRGAGSGTSNFVVFPGEEGLLTILERNGVPLR